MIGKTINWIKYNRYKILMLFSIVLTMSIFLMISMNVHASGDKDTESKIIKILMEHDQYFKLRTVLSDTLRSATWGLIKGLYLLVYKLEKVLYDSLEMYGFVEFMQEHSIYTKLLSNLVATLMAGTLSWIGVKMLLNNGEVPQLKSVVLNSFISIILIVGMPFMMSSLQDGVEYVWGVKSDTSQVIPDDQLQPDKEDKSTQALFAERVSLQPIQENLIDLYIPFNRNLDIEDFLTGKDSEKSIVTKDEHIKLVEPNEFFKIGDYPFETKNMSDVNQALLESTLDTSDDDDGKLSVQLLELDKVGWFKGLFGGTFESGYYRYSWRTVPILISLLALAFAFFNVIFSIIRIYIEMAFQLIASPVLLATDLETGQKTKKMLHDIMTGFLSIAFEVMAFRIFIAFYSWLDVNRLGIPVYLMAIMAGTTVLISGSKTIMAWFGVDLGLNDGISGISRMATMFGVGKAISGVSKFAGKVGDKIRDRQNEDSESNHNGDKTENLDLNDEETPRPDDDSLGKIGKLGRAVGYAKSRGTKGLSEDLAELGVETLNAGADVVAEGTKTAVDSVADKTIKPIKDGIDDFKSSYSAGSMEAQSKKELEGDTDFINSLDGIKEDSTISSDEGANRPMTNTFGEGENKESIKNIREQLDSIDFSQPEEAIRDVQDKIKNDSNIDPTISQGVIQELEKVNSMTPENARQHVEQVLNQARDANLAPQTESVQVQTEEVSRDNLPQVSRETIQPLTDAVRKINEVQGDTIAEKTENIQQQVLQNARQPEVVEQIVQQSVKSDLGNSLSESKMNDITQKVRTVREQANHHGWSEEVVKQKVQKQVEDVLNSSSVDIPETKQTKVIQNVTEASIGNTSGTQRVIQQIENASEATPSQFQRNVTRAFSRTFEGANEVLSPKMQTEVQGILKEGLINNTPSKEIIQNVIEKTKNMDFKGNEPLREQIINKIKDSNIVNEQQLQSNLRKVRETEKKNIIRK